MFADKYTKLQHTGKSRPVKWGLTVLKYLIYMEPFWDVL